MRAAVIVPMLALALLAALVLGGRDTQAVHDLGLFELDRNALDSGAAGDDWDTPPKPGGGATRFTGILDEFPTVPTPVDQFCGGGSKDDSDITDWRWLPSEKQVPDKDNITNAYAAAYINTVDTGKNKVGDLIIYFGLDRFSNDGDAQIGFWFLQGKVTQIDDKANCGLRFSGQHAVGDILVQSNFSQGGVIENLSVFKWVGSGGDVPPAGTLDTIVASTPGAGGDCVGPPAPLLDDAVCATVNRDVEVAPWPYTPKKNIGPPQFFQQGSFFEGGLNLTRLAPEAVCLSTFVAETRTSQSTTARLKDKVLSGFDLCDLAVDKDGDTLGKVGDDVDYTITISNPGAVTLYKDDISDTLFGNMVVNGVNQADPNDFTSINFATATPCGASLAPLASCTIKVTRTVQAGDPDPLDNEVTVTYNAKADFTSTALTRIDDHSVNLFQPKIAVDKTGDTLSKIGDPVDYKFTLSNNSSADTPDLKCTAKDTLLGTIFDGVLAAGDTVINKQRTVLAADPDPLKNEVTLACVVQAVPAKGFDGGNKLEVKDDHTVDLFSHDVAIIKDCQPREAAPGDTITYTITIKNLSDGDLNTTALDGFAPDLVLDSVIDVGDGWAGLGDLTASFPASLPLGGSDAQKFLRAIQPGDPNPLKDTVTVTTHPVGFPSNVDKASASCEVEIVGCALSPGFWKGGDGVPKWDEVTDPIAIAAGFHTGKIFPFLDSSLAGSTYLDVIKLPAKGDVTRQMAFKYIAARLNEAVFGVPSGIDTLLDNIDVYFAANPVGSDPNGSAKAEGQSLLSDLNAYFAAVGEEFCPDPSTF